METQQLAMFQSTIQYSGEFIYIKPICDFFDINYENQCRVIGRDSLLKKWSTKKSNSLLFGDNYPRILLSKRGFIRWIQQLNHQIIQVDLREKLLQYQELVFDFLFESAEREEKVKLDYARLHKLKRLKAKINLEINRCEAEIQNYLSGKCSQTTLNFPQQSIEA